MNRIRMAGMVVLCGAAAGARAQDVAFFPFAQVGGSYSAAIFGDNPLIGREVVAGRVLIRLEVRPPGDAADFGLDIALPVDQSGNSPFYATDGVTLGWSGHGDFEFDLETNEFNGVIIARRYGAESFGEHATLSDDSGIYLTLAPAACDADFNGDGFLDFFDFDDFVACFEGGACPPGKSADFNGDGFVDFFDYDDFVAGFEAGC